MSIEFGTPWTEWAALLLAALNILIFAVSIRFLAKQIRTQQAQLTKQQAQLEKTEAQISKEHDWNRRKAALDLLVLDGSAEMLEMRRRVDVAATWHDARQDYSNLSGEQRTSIDRDLKTYLNYLEGVALGVKHCVYDREISFEYFGALLPEVFRWAEPYIADRRSKANDLTIWLELEKLAEEWRRANKEVSDSLRTSAWRQGKPPT